MNDLIPKRCKGKWITPQYYPAIAIGALTGSAAAAALWHWTTLQAQDIAAWAAGMYLAGMLAWLFYMERLRQQRQKKAESDNHAPKSYRSGETVFIDLVVVRSVKHKTIRMKQHFWTRLKAKHYQQCLDEIGAWRC